ncbi:hypothetical protein BCR37DRAFT_388215 [Protomyces lactucae-debilis]|uniref:Cyanovirin-N domain-containing protein n=1 Tax=Protomyces lactucae-debilis TaxID=2754530 RepID=A0A1Y2F9B7_PROLT|nr:uncharacterized protein BCR37DRAFT_388215 [Protomyces lactucae-debilis]ORY80510.1 hypothetical protein BCR37DRAFT_388215 [Protomyces lactucae-debilis]
MSPWTLMLLSLSHMASATPGPGSQSILGVQFHFNRTNVPLGQWPVCRNACLLTGPIVSFPDVSVLHDALHTGCLHNAAEWSVESWSEGDAPDKCFCKELLTYVVTERERPSLGAKLTGYCDLDKLGGRLKNNLNNLYHGADGKSGLDGSEFTGFTHEIKEFPQ